MKTSPKNKSTCRLITAFRLGKHATVVVNGPLTCYNLFSFPTFRTSQAAVNFANKNHPK